MEITGTIKGAAAVVTALGIIGGGFATMDDRHAPADKVLRMEASGHVNTIQGWIRAAREEGPSESFCEAIRAELIALCTSQKDHYLCSEKASNDILKRAGCEV